MPTCPECGGTYERFANFCSFCGHDVRRDLACFRCHRKYDRLAGTHFSWPLLVLLAAALLLILAGSLVALVLTTTGFRLDHIGAPTHGHETGRLKTLKVISDAPLPPDARCDEWVQTAEKATICASDTEAEALTGKCKEVSNPQAYLSAPPAMADRDYPHGTAPIFLCVRPKKSNLTRTALAGPFRSRVQEWHSLHFMAPLLRAGDRIVRFTGDAVSASDAATTIGYPPLHMHHVHVTNAGVVAPHWFETHGDYVDADAGAEHGAEHGARAGGKSGYSLASPPAGACVLKEDEREVEVSAQVNDVRFSTGTAMAGGEAGGGHTEYERLSWEALRAKAPSYSWYFRVEFELAEPDGGVESAQAEEIAAAARREEVLDLGSGPSNASTAPRPARRMRASPPCTPVRKLALMSPMDEHAFHDVLARYDAGNRETLFMYSMAFPYSGTVVPPGWMHSHRARHGGFLLLRGEHSLASLLARTAADAHRLPTQGRGAAARSYAMLLAALPPADRVRALRRSVLDLAGEERVLCRDDETAPTSLSIAETGDGHGGHFDRQGRTLCKPFAFRRGEMFTVFSFARPNWAAHLSVFPQHTMLFLFYTPTTDGDVGRGGVANDRDEARHHDGHDTQMPPSVEQLIPPMTFRVLDLNCNLPDARALLCKTEELRSQRRDVNRVTECVVESAPCGSGRALGLVHAWSGDALPVPRRVGVSFNSSMNVLVNIHTALFPRSLFPPIEFVSSSVSTYVRHVGRPSEEKVGG